MKKFNSKMGKTSLVMSSRQETKALKMKSFYIMAEGTEEALKKDETIDKAVMLEYSKVQKFIKEHKGEIFKNGTKFKINVLTDEGWRGAKNGYFRKNEEPIFYDAAKNYDDDRAAVDEVYMVQILVL